MQNTTSSKLQKPKQARSLKKRKQLLAAGELEFARAGFVGATSKSIAQRAGVATGSFYQHFENKDELLREIARRRFALLQDNITQIQSGRPSLEQSSVVDIFRNSLTFIYTFHEQSPELHQVLEERRHQDAELAKIMADGEAVLQQRVLLFVQSFNLAQPEMVASALFAMAEGLVHRHVFEVTHFSAKQLINQGAVMLAAYFEAQR